MWLLLSMMSNVGTTPIGAGIEETYFTFDLPVGLLNETPLGERPQALTLRLEVANFLTEASCEQIHPDAAWTKIFADSYFVARHLYMPLPDLQAFPYPFVSDQPHAPTTIVLPPEPNGRELGLALSLAATLGHFAPADFELHLLTADQASPETQAGANLIVLGSSERQPLANQFLEAMGAVPGYRGQAGLYQALKSQQSGLLREAPSPWNDERVALLVFGRSEAGFEQAARALFNAAPPVARPGSVAVVEPGQPPRIIYRAIEAVPEAEPGQVQREPLIAPPPPWVVITLILVVTTLAVLAIIGFSRHWAARQRTE